MSPYLWPQQTLLRSVAALAWLAFPALASAQALPAVVVDAVRAGAGEESVHRLIGHVHPRQEMTLTSAESGRVDWILEPGTAVEAGATVVQLDTAPLLLQREELQARLQRDRVALKHMDQRLERARSLDARALLSATEMDDLRERRALAAADIAIAEAQLAQLDLRLTRTRVTAPFAGSIGLQYVFAGEDVAAGTRLAELTGTATMEVRAQVPLRWLASVQPGRKLQISAASRRGEAVVRRVLAVADTESQTLELRADLEDQTGPWAIGELVTVAWPDTDIQSVLLVPRDAVVLRRSGARVVRVDEAETTHWVPVSLGRGQGDWVIVQGELQPGDRVAIRGAERVGDGVKVQVLRDLAAEPAPTPQPSGLG